MNTMSGKTKNLNGGHTARCACAECGNGASAAVRRGNRDAIASDAGEAALALAERILAGGANGNDARNLATLVKLALGGEG